MRKLYKTVAKNTNTVDFYLSKNFRFIHPLMRKKMRKMFNCAHQSPYSISVYDNPNKNWGSNDTGFLRFSDHWNFFSKGELHAKTNKPVTKNNVIAICDDKNVWNILYSINYAPSTKKRYLARTKKYVWRFKEVVQMTNKEVRQVIKLEKNQKEFIRQIKLKEKLNNKKGVATICYTASIKSGRKFIYQDRKISDAIVSIKGNMLNVFEDKNDAEPWARFNISTNKSLDFKVIKILK